MTTTDRHYLHRLGYHLQRRQLPDDRIDDILAEARAHSALSGESLGEAFGSPREYARRWPAGRPDPTRTIIAGVAAVLGCAALLVGSLRLADSFGVTALGLLALGTVALVGAAAVAPLRALRDPVSSCPRPSRSAAVLLTLIGCTVISGAGVLGALL